MNFNLKEFISAGYGKHLKVMNSEYKSFNKRKDKDFNKEEREKIQKRRGSNCARVVYRDQNKSEGKINYKKLGLLL